MQTMDGRSARLAVRKSTSCGVIRFFLDSLTQHTEGFCEYKPRRRNTWESLSVNFFWHIPKRSGRSSLQSPDFGVQDAHQHAQSQNFSRPQCNPTWRGAHQSTLQMYGLT